MHRRQPRRRFETLIGRALERALATGRRMSSRWDRLLLLALVAGSSGAVAIHGKLAQEPFFAADNASLLAHLAAQLPERTAAPIVCPARVELREVPHEQVEGGRAPAAYVSFPWHPPWFVHMYDTSYHNGTTDTHLFPSLVHNRKSDVHFPDSSTHRRNSNYHATSSDTHLTNSDTHAATTDVHYVGSDTHSKNSDQHFVSTDRHEYPSQWHNESSDAHTSGSGFHESGSSSQSSFPPPPPGGCGPYLPNEGDCFLERGGAVETSVDLDFAALEVQYPSGATFPMTFGVDVPLKIVSFLNTRNSGRERELTGQVRLTALGDPGVAQVREGIQQWYPGLTKAVETDLHRGCGDHVHPAVPTSTGLAGLSITIRPVKPGRVVFLFEVDPDPEPEGDGLPRIRAVVTVDVPERNLNLLYKAFIACDLVRHPGYVGPSISLTPCGPHVTGGDLLEGDGRTFGFAAGAVFGTPLGAGLGSRLASLVVIDPVLGPQALSEFGRSSCYPDTAAGPASSPICEFERLPTATPLYSDQLPAIPPYVSAQTETFSPPGWKHYMIKLDVDAPIPILPQSCHIDVDLMIDVDWWGGHWRIAYKGMRNDYPAHEFYAQVDGRSPLLLADFSPAWATGMWPTFPFQGLCIRVSELSSSGPINLTF